MSTNDTLRGLLRESYSELLAIKAAIGFRAETISLIGRIDAALAEPVSGGVVLPERVGEQTIKSLRGKELAFVEGYNSYADDVAALNGGAAAGQADRDPFGLAGCVEELLFVGEPPHFECAKSVVIRCACKDCITSRALSALSNRRAATKAAPICDCRQGRDACTCKGGE